MLPRLSLFFICTAALCAIGCGNDFHGFGFGDDDEPPRSVRRCLDDAESEREVEACVNDVGGAGPTGESGSGCLDDAEECLDDARSPSECRAELRACLGENPDEGGEGPPEDAPSGDEPDGHDPDGEGSDGEGPPEDAPDGEIEEPGSDGPPPLGEECVSDEVACIELVGEACDSDLCVERGTAVCERRLDECFEALFGEDEGFIPGGEDGDEDGEFIGDGEDEDEDYDSGFIPGGEDGDDDGEFIGDEDHDEDEDVDEAIEEARGDLDEAIDEARRDFDEEVDEHRRDRDEDIDEDRAEREERRRDRDDGERGRGGDDECMQSLEACFDFSERLCEDDAECSAHVAEECSERFESCIC